MLVYNPAFDIYHSVYRIILLLHYMKKEEVELDRLRIWDFFLAFPFEASKIKFPTEYSDLRKIFKAEQNPYDEMLDSKKVFQKMKSFQISALNCVAAYGLIEPELWREQKVSKIKKELPKELQEKINNIPVKTQNIIKLLIGPFGEVDLLGDNGLKCRTGLIEFRYDSK